MCRAFKVAAGFLLSFSLFSPLLQSYGMRALTLLALHLACSSALDPALCKLPNLSPRGDVAIGFPRLPYRLNPVGARRFSILAVDFSDLPATRTPLQLLSQLAPAAAFYGAVSYSRLQAELVLGVPGVVRMPLPSTAYSFATFDSHRSYLRNATGAACGAGWDPAGGWDSVVVMAAVATPALSFGPAFCAVPGEGYAACTSDVVFLNSATSGNDFPAWGFKWFNHENSHTMGLVDLYAFEPEAGAGEFRYTGQWSLMGDIGGAAPELFGWERWLLGWLLDAQVACLGAGEARVALAPLSGSAGPGAAPARLLVIPTASALNSTGIAVELRRPQGYDAGIPKGGLLVYALDTSLATGAGPLRVLNAEEADGAKLQAPLAVGESLTIGGVRIEHTSTDAQGNAVVSVSVAAEAAAAAP